MLLILILLLILFLILILLLLLLLFRKSKRSFPSTDLLGFPPGCDKTRPEFFRTSQPGFQGRNRVNLGIVNGRVGI